MPSLQIVLPGHATKKNSTQSGHRPSKAFQKWEDACIPILRRLRAERKDLPIGTAANLSITVHVKGPEGDAFGYGQAVGDLLDGTRARFAHQRMQRQLGALLPFKCDYQIVENDRLFNLSASICVIRTDNNPRTEIIIEWNP